MIEGIGAMLSGEATQQLAIALVPLSESLTQSMPYIFAGLAVALGFQGGLFNIGAEGQMFMGALARSTSASRSPGLPWFVHLPLALLAGHRRRRDLGLASPACSRPTRARTR